MSRDDELRISDIVDAAVELEEVVAMGYENFLKNSIAVRAAERLLEIIGEAANSVDEETEVLYPHVEWRDIKRLRIVLAHHYHRVDPDQVWTISSVDVPKLKLALEASD